MIISQDENTTFLTLDANLLGTVADANGNITQIQEALGYGYHNALSKKFIDFPVLAISSIVAYVAMLLAEDQYLISTNDNIKPLKLGLSASDTKALEAAPDPGFLIISKVGQPGLVTVTMAAGEAPVATGSADCPEMVRKSADRCNLNVVL